MRFSDEPNQHVPAADPGSVAAAVFLERLVEDPSAENPPMNDEEAIRGSPVNLSDCRALLRTSRDGFHLAERPANDW
jgi:hypothetical protein